MSQALQDCWKAYPIFAGRHQPYLVEGISHICWKASAIFAGRHQPYLLEGISYICWKASATFAGRHQPYLLEGGYHICWKAAAIFAGRHLPYLQYLSKVIFLAFQGARLAEKWINNEHVNLLKVIKASDFQIIAKYFLHQLLKYICNWSKSAVPLWCFGLREAEQRRHSLSNCLLRLNLGKMPPCICQTNQATTISSPINLRNKKRKSRRKQIGNKIAQML